MPHHRQIVGDEQIGKAEFFLQVFEQVDDLRLDRYIQRRHRLVAHDERRLHRQRARNAHALTLPARQLVRIASRHVIKQPDEFEQLNHLGARRRFVWLQAVNQQRLGDAVADGHARIQRTERILKNHLHLAAIVFQRIAVGMRDVHTRESDGAGSGFLQPQQRAPDRGFAAARLTHQADGFALEYLERQIIHCAHFGFFSAESF